jgi:hypothetical protein
MTTPKDRGYKAPACCRTCAYLRHGILGEGMCIFGMSKKAKDALAIFNSTHFYLGIPKEAMSEMSHHTVDERGLCDAYERR